MSRNPDVQRSLGNPSMGRKRTKHHNLPPRMQQKGSAYYYVYNAKPRKWEPLGNDLARAKRRWAEIESGPGTSLSVGDLAQQYMDREKRSDGTTIQYRSYQLALAKAFPIPAAQLRSMHVALWRELQSHRKNYANGCIALLMAAARVGHELGQCELITVGLWPVTGRDRDLLPAEFLAIRNSAVEWLQVAMDIGYLTAARPSDIRALRWDQVGDVVGMRQKKTLQRMKFIMNEDLAEVFSRAKQRPILGLYVVATDKGRPVSRRVFGDAWRAARAASGIEDAQFRDIRAMAAKASEEGGQDFQALLGHTTRAMSMKYLKGRRTIKAEPLRKRL